MGTASSIILDVKGTQKKIMDIIGFLKSELIVKLDEKLK